MWWKVWEFQTSVPIARTRRESAVWAGRAAGSLLPWTPAGWAGCMRRGVSRERSTGHCVHVVHRSPYNYTATAGKAISTREIRWPRCLEPRPLYYCQQRRQAANVHDHEARCLQMWPLAASYQHFFHLACHVLLKLLLGQWASRHELCLCYVYLPICRCSFQPTRSLLYL